LQTLNAMNKEIDVRHVAPTVRVPTLVLCLTDDADWAVEGSKYMARHIPGARLVEIPGRGHIPTRENADAFIGEIDPFLRNAPPEPGWEAPDHDGVLATLLFTDIVGSTARAAEMGDRQWRQLLAQHHDLVRSELIQHRGQELDTAGDGFF